MAARERIETRRSRAISEAQGLGIDTDGMSTRQVNAAISTTREAQQGMADFINKVLDARPVAGAEAPAVPANPTTRVVEDAPSRVYTSPSGGIGRGSNSVPVEFYTFVDGVVGTVIVQCQSAPSPL
jgi:hypothetical protein